MRITPYAINHPVATATAVTMNLGAAPGMWLTRLAWFIFKGTMWLAVAMLLGTAWAVYMMCKWSMVAGVWLVRRFRPDGSNFGDHQAPTYPEGVLFRG